MNKLDESKTNVIDSSGKIWKLDVPHPMPLPEGIKQCWMMVYFYPDARHWETCGYLNATHWLLRPEPPAPKTQEEMDEEAYQSWIDREDRVANQASRSVWHAGVAHGRKQP